MRCVLDLIGQGAARPGTVKAGDPRPTLLLMYNLFAGLEPAGEDAKVETNQTAAPTFDRASARQYVLDRYAQRIQYYWDSSQSNKRHYKATRYLTVVLGATVTLIASLSSADFVKSVGWLSVFFAVGTPLLAATLAIIGGVSQAFQWGATWSDMVVSATRLEKERDRIAVTSPEQIDPAQELAALDDFLLAETQTFFQRIFGSAGQGKTGPEPPAAA